MSLFAILTQSSVVRTEWPTFNPMSHRVYNRPFVSADKFGCGLPRAVEMLSALCRTADGYQGESGRRSFRFHPRVVLDGFQNGTQQHVQHGRSCPANFAPAGAGMVEDFEPVRLNLEEIFVARQFLRGLAIGREWQTFGGAGRDLFQQCRH